MPKVLSQAGISLADAYEIQGSIAGVEQLRSEEVALVHEMGGTMFSERITGGMVRLTSGAIAQSTDFNISMATPIQGLMRILGCFVQIDTAGRLTNAQLSNGSTIGGDEHDCPFWAWATGAGEDFERGIIVQASGAAVAGRVMLVPSNRPNIPGMIIGDEQRIGVPQIRFRGQSAAFGAGTVTAIATLYVASAADPRLTSYGLPIPSW